MIPGCKIFSGSEGDQDGKMWMAALKFESSEMLRWKVQMAKRRDQEFFKNLCFEMCIYVIRNVCSVCVMRYVCA